MIKILLNMNYQMITQYGAIFLLALLLIFFIIFSFYFKYFKEANKKDKVFEEAKVNYKYAILIPARKESRVIGNLFKSLNEQTYPKEFFKVFTITEKEEDKTNQIALSYGYNYIVRKDLTNRHTKGCALEEGYKYLIEKNIEFDSLIIIDADNILDKDFLLELNKLKNDGYQVGVGKRYSSNTNNSIISAQSALLFQYQSNIINKARVALFNKFAISGTGYYIDKNIIDYTGGWIFLGLTEDVELTRYCYHHNIKMGYNSNAIFYDEQPVDFKTLHKQHVRWVWGYFNKKSYQKFKKEVPINGKAPLLARFEHANALSYFILNEALFLIHGIFSLIVSIFAFFDPSFFISGVNFGLFIFDIFMMFAICSIANLVELLLLKEKTNIKPKMKVKVVLLGFIFWADFLLAVLDGFFTPSKRTAWERIKHTGKK